MDSEWVDAGNRRAAFYNNIKPGFHTFRVRGCNNDGVWNQAGASLAFEMRPHFWQTKWFLGLSALAAIGIVAGVARYVTWKRVRERLVRLEQDHAIERERTRIAQDMHDDLGARLTEILLLSDRGARSDGSQNAPKAFAEVNQAAREVIRNLGSIVWAVNPENDSLDQFAGYVQGYAEHYFAASSIHCRFDFRMSCRSFRCPRRFGTACSW